MVMEEFKLVMNTNTFLIRCIRFFAAFILGLSTAKIIHTYKMGNEFEWMSIFTIIIPGTLYSFYPWKKQALIINEFGIYTKGYAYVFNETNKIKWIKIRRIEIKEPGLLTKGKIKIIKTIGSSEIINLPMHIRHQLPSFKNFLARMSKINNVEYS